MKWPKKAKGFEVPLYGGRVYLCSDFATWNACQEYLGNNFDARGAGLCGQYVHPEEGCINLVGVFAGGTATLIHELSHCAFNILGRAGVPVKDYEANEAYAYLLDTLYTESIKYIKLER